MRKVYIIISDPIFFLRIYKIQISTINKKIDC